ncbi:rhodanese-like domain-containing protein [Porphyrobacter sp. GA68]|uniref:rhodanese-like domain-containing protein n=1 Tax=Porphyrobacter sp. GA68 TaxID=2883480 RepID=UPI001D1925FB|nr:rhodanese-like domain-containing protein [Porphyrobacter sp. GA68]
MRVLLLAAAAILVPGCASTDAQVASPSAVSTAEARVATLSAPQLKALVDSGQVVLIDVRTPYEFADGRIAGALNMPLTHFDAAAIPDDRSREIILYCGTSRRSQEAAEKLAAVRGGVVRHLAGGFGAWTTAGYASIANQPADDPRRR